MGSLSLSRQHCWSQYNIAHSETSLRGDVQAWEQQVCGMCLGSVESRFLDVKVPHVATNTSISVEDVGSGGSVLWGNEVLEYVPKSAVWKLYGFTSNHFPSSCVLQRLRWLRGTFCVCW